MKRATFFLVCALSALLARADDDETAVLEPAEHYGEIARLLVGRLQRDHVSRMPLDDTISKRTWKNCLSALDPAHLYFLESDIAKLREHELTLDNEVGAGDVAFAYDAFRVFRERVRERCKYVKQLLDKGFDLNKDETYHWQRKDEPWPADRAEQDELWRKRVKNEYIQQVLAREEEEAEESAATGEAPDGSAVPQGDPVPGGTNTATARPNAIPAWPAPTNLTTRAALTNATPEAGSTNVTTEASATPEPEEPEPPLPPAEWIVRQYEKFLTSLDELDAEWVLQRYLSALTHSYDPHCDYMSPPVAENFDISMKLSLVGIGAVLTTEDGATKVVRIVPGGPADCDPRDIKLQPDDKIIAVAQSNAPPVDIMHWPLKNVVHLIRGEKGTKVVLTVIPNSDPTGTTRTHIDLIRDEVQLDEGSARQDTREVHDPNGNTRKIGIITLPAFYSDMEARRNKEADFKSSSQDIERILEQMETNNVDGVILDLRNDGGGALVEAALVTGLFIKSGPVVQVLAKRRISIYPDVDPAVAYAGPLIVLVNRFSASASEIVAAALQDYGRALIIGDSKTHGKGTVQGVSQLSDDPRMGSAKITHALFFRVNGSSTQLKGVSPHIRIPSIADTMEVGEDFLDNPLEWFMLRPVQHAVDTTIEDALPALIERSIERRASSDRFAEYKEVLERMAEMRRQEESSLNIDKRREQIRQGKELQERLKELQKAADEDGEPKDMVLAESLQIMADLIDLTGNGNLPGKGARR